MTQKFQQMPDHGNLTVQVEEGMHIYADKNAITVLVNNLLENAWKYSPQDKNISVKAMRKDKSVVLEIGDKGIGIPGKEKTKIFNKFYRVGNEETRRTKGTGLGLFICKYIIDQHDAKVNISDNEPHGTIVTVDFPSISEK
jgi:K+-sensing histidine kinase KdpD